MSPGGASDTNRPIWDDGSRLGLPALSGTLEADVCVVGLGGSGLAAISRLLEAGLNVVGVDAGIVAGGAAGRNGGFLLAGMAEFHHQLAAQIGATLATQLYELTRIELARMGAETPEVIRQVGSLRIAGSSDELEDCAVQLEQMQADGLPVEAYQGFEGGGLLFPEDAVFQPFLRCMNLAKRALAEGAELFEHSAVLEIRSGETCEVLTTDGRVRAKHVIVAVDGRLELLLPELAPKVRTARLQMLATAPTAGLRLPRAVYARYGFEYWQQLPDGRIALGGFRDHGGEDEWTSDANPSEVVQTQLERFLHDLGIRAPITQRWAASVAYSHDHLPILEQVRPKVWACGAYAGTGNIVGAMCARSACEMILFDSSPVFTALQAAHQMRRQGAQ